VIKSFPFLETTRNKMLRVIGSEKVRASLYLSRQDLGLAKKNSRRNNDTTAMSPKTIEATG